MVLFCRCAIAEIISAEVRGAVLSGLRDQGIRHLVVRDLCELAANRDPMLQEVSREPVFAIVACYPRAVRGLFYMAGIDLSETNAKLYNMREQTAEEILQQVQLLGTAENPSPNRQDPDNIGWNPWFPVIDYGRCRNCQQCLSFCLFGVYGLSDEGRVEVRNPRSCKTNCPACARICPEVAIMFPKYSQAPINGAEIEDEVAVREAVRINVSQILGDDVYKALAERRRRYIRMKSSSDTQGQQPLGGASS